MFFMFSTVEHLNDFTCSFSVTTRGTVAVEEEENPVVACGSDWKSEEEEVIATDVQQT